MNIKKNQIWIVLLVLSFIGIGLYSSVSVGQPEKAIASLEQTSKAFTSVAKKAIPAVVFIQTERKVSSGATPGMSNQFGDPFGFFGDEFFKRQPQPPREYRQRGQGSGFIFNEDGLILTNHHVVRDADKITVRLHDGREFEATTIGSDEKTDIAVIQIDGKNLPMVGLGDSDEIEIGEWVVAVGNPFGLAETITAGIVSAKSRNNVGLADYEDFIQTDAAINPGNSGGPLLNLRGEVIGINTAIATNNGGYMGVGFAIPVNMVQFIKDQLLESGKVTRGQMGVLIQEINQQLAESFKLESTKGALVAEVTPDSPAEKAGLKSGDVIRRINGKEVVNIGELRNHISMLAPETKVSLDVIRDGKEKNISVTIGVMSDEPAQVKAESLSENLGLMVQEITDEVMRFYQLDSKEGLIVTQVKPGSSAVEAGIKPGVVILSVNQERVNSLTDFNRALGKSQESKRVLMLIKEREGTRFAVLDLR